MKYFIHFMCFLCSVRIWERRIKGVDRSRERISQLFYIAAWNKLVFMIAGLFEVSRLLFWRVLLLWSLLFRSLLFWNLLLGSRTYKNGLFIGL